MITAEIMSMTDPVSTADADGFITISRVNLLNFSQLCGCG